MKISDDMGNEIVEPAAEVIRKVVEGLGPDRDEGFAILERAEQFYMQVSGNSEEGFVLEYREGSEDQHFGVYGQPLTTEDIVAAFLEYHRGEDGFTKRHQWEKTF